jgi:hypothetical protein
MDMKDFFQKIFGQKGEINYLYFSLLLLFLTVLSLSHYFTRDLPLKGLSLCFLLYAFGQALFEVFCFVLLAHILKRWTPRWLYFSYIYASVILMILHFANFLMVRLMDASLVYIFKFFFGSGLAHPIAGFQALNMNATMIWISLAVMIFLPLASITLYSITHRIAKKWPLKISLFQIILTIAVTGVSLFFLDLLIHPFISNQFYAKYQKTLPLGTTFITPTPDHLILANPFPPPRDEKQTLAAIPPLSAHALPNIYLFIIETFRRDFLDAAPHLSAFGKEHLEFPKSYANASSTYLSWFAILHSNMPFYWAQMRDAWEGGSIPLRMLKNMGYHISVLSSADLRYFKMDKLLFGAKKELVDLIEEFPLNLKAWERDALCFSSLKEKIKPEGEVYIVFLDSPHSEYSFPDDYPIPFQPIASEIDYFTIGPKSPDLELIKNRYRNSIHYVDHSLGQFFDFLKEKGLYQNAIIAITGDHGEEFFEDGALFHGVHLNEYSTSVPLMLKFPLSKYKVHTSVATHMDIMPSILHYLTENCDFSALFDGRSIFSKDQLPFRISVKQNGPDIPIEFLLEGEDLKLKARFEGTSKLEILELQGYLTPDIFNPLSK